MTALESLVVGLLSIAAGLVVLGALFAVLCRRWPAIPQKRWFPEIHVTDLCYCFLSPTVNGTVIRWAIPGAVVVAAILVGAPHDRIHLDAWMASRRTLVGLQPRGLQAVEFLFLADFLGYWAHRLLHGRALWKFHAVHHSPRKLDWLSATRLHPIDEIVARLIQTLPLFFLGFRGDLLAVLAPILPAYSLFVHANLSWSFGPLRYVLVSPTFHRWHHTSEREGLDKNFAGLFPIFDLVFGTFYLPESKKPVRFGVTGEKVPDSFLAQLAYPFRKEEGASRR